MQSSCKTRWGWPRKCDKHLKWNGRAWKCWDMEWACAERREKERMEAQEGWGELVCVRVCACMRVCVCACLVSYWSHLIILNHSLLPWEHLTLLSLPLSGSYNPSCLPFTFRLSSFPRLRLYVSVSLPLPLVHSGHSFNYQVKVKWG